MALSLLSGNIRQARGKIRPDQARSCQIKPDQASGRPWKASGRPRKASGRPAGRPGLPGSGQIQAREGAAVAEWLQMAPGTPG